MSVEGEPTQPEHRQGKLRKVWVAVVMTLLTPGLGHLYAGRPKRGALFWGLSWVFSISGCLLLVGGLLLPSWPAPWSLLPLLMLIGVGLAYVVYVLIDTVQVTRAVTTFELQRFNRWYVYAAIVILSSITG